MASAEGRVGELSINDTQFATARLDKRSQLVTVGGGGNYQEAAYRKRMYSGANQGPAGTTTTVGLAATYTGLVIMNPIASTINMVVMSVGYTVTAAPTAASIIGLMGSYAVTDNGAGTALVARNNWLGTTTTGLVDGQGLVKSASVLVNAPWLVTVLGQVAITGATAQAAVPPTIQSVFDLNGQFVLPPGGALALYTSTVVAVIASFTWAEIPL